MLAKRRGLLRSCSGRGWTWEEEVTNRTLADMQQGQAWGGGVKATGNLEPPVGLLRDLG